jgi:hypothetical protein
LAQRRLLNGRQFLVLLTFFRKAPFNLALQSLE